MMGVGKTTVGGKLAALLDVAFVDTDTLVAQHARTTITAIFKTRGEAFFRQLENEVLTELIADRKRAVIAVGGGLPCFGNNAAVMLKAGVCVYLEARPAQLAARLMREKSGRPLLADAANEAEVLQRLEALLAKRRSCYEQAHLKVNAEALDVSALAASLQHDFGF